MTVEAGDALSGRDGTAAAASSDEAVPDALGEGPPPTPPAAPHSIAPVTGTTAAPPAPKTAAEAGPKSAETAGPSAAPAEGDPAAARSHPPAWLSGGPTRPWPPPGAVGPRVRAASAIPPPRRPAVPGRAERIPGPPPMPRITEEPAILGLSRLTRGRFGSRVFTWFFVLVFTLIAVQMVVSILYPW